MIDYEEIDTLIGENEFNLLIEKALKSWLQSLLHIRLRLLRRIKYGPGAIGLLLEGAGLDQAVDDVHRLLAVVHVVLLQLQLPLERLELGELHLEFHLLLVGLPAIFLDLGSGAAPLRADLEHVDAHASLDYNNR